VAAPRKLDADGRRLASVARSPSLPASSATTEARMHEGTKSPIASSESPRAKLFLRDVGASVSADVYHRSASRLTVRRELQFLRVGTDVVDEEGRRANIASVRVYVQNDIPTLIMDLRYPSNDERRDESLPQKASGRRDDLTPVRGEETVVFGTARDANPRIVSSRASLLDELVSSVRRLIGTILRVSRGIRVALSSGTPARP